MERTVVVMQSGNLSVRREEVVQSAVGLLSDVLPGLSGWLDAAPVVVLSEAPTELADLIAPLSGGIVIGRRLGGKTPGDLPVAMLIDALSSPAATRWEMRIQRALVSRSEEPASWAGCLLRPGETRARVREQIAALDALRCWLVVTPTRPDLKARLTKTMLKLMFAPEPVGVVLSEVVTEATQRAWLDLSGRGEASWERQRSGFLGHVELIGDLFGPLLIAEAAAAAGLDAAPLLARVLASRVGEGIRYYRDCPELPHDADDAAALLIAARACPSAMIPASLCLEAEAVLSEAVSEDGVVSTWIVRGQGPAAGWLGSHCAGVAARVVLATSSVVGGRWLAGLAERDGGWIATHYPCRILTTGLVLRALAPLRADPGIAAAHDAGADWLAAQQEADGTIGGTALSTAVALRAGVLSEQGTAEAAAALVLHQRWDGQWPQAPLFICPHPGDRMQPFASPALSTAIVLAALSGM
ncbi:MAG: hypothetical protein ACI8RZ_000398 [Myxococcota bacterium]|jgi:hypothetical protein